MLSLYMKLRSLTTRQEGQGMVEYALMLVLVSIVVIVILLTMGNQIKNFFSNVVAALGALSPRISTFKRAPRGALFSLQRIGAKISVRVITMAPLLWIPSEVT